MAKIRLRDISLFVKAVGKGYPLLLMHGGPGQDHTSLLPLIPCGDQFTLVFYDHRCNGCSTGAGVTTMTWENLTADAEALREYLGYEKWAVLGHSFGGYVALEYALRYPQSVSHLILMDTGGDVSGPQQLASQILAERGFSRSAVEAQRRFFHGQLKSYQFFPLTMKFMNAYFYRPPSLLGLAHDILFGPRVKFQPAAAIFGCSTLVKDWTVMERLNEISVPALVLAGSYDFLFPPQVQSMLASHLPNARLELIERAGHNPQVEQTDVVIEVLRGFLSEVAEKRVEAAHWSA